MSFICILDGVHISKPPIIRCISIIIFFLSTIFFSVFSVHNALIPEEKEYGPQGSGALTDNC